MWAEEAEEPQAAARPPAAVPIRRPSAAGRALAAREPLPDAPPRGTDISEFIWEKPREIPDGLHGVLSELPGIPDPALLLDTSTNPVEMYCVHIFSRPHHCAAEVCCDNNQW